MSSETALHGMEPLAAPPEPAVPEGLSEKLRTLPEQAGVYLMKDKAGRVLYVGKASSLRARVRQYFQAGHTDSPAFCTSSRRSRTSRPSSAPTRWRL